VLNVGQSNTPNSFSESNQTVDPLLTSESVMDAQARTSYQPTFSTAQNGIENDCAPFCYEDLPGRRHYSPFSERNYTSNPAPVIYVQQNPSAPFFLTAQPTAHSPY
jgi:hypothetical protein